MPAPATLGEHRVHPAALASLSHPYLRVVVSSRTGEAVDVVQTRTAQESYRWARRDMRAGFYGEPVYVELYRAGRDGPYHVLRGPA